MNDDVGVVQPTCVKKEDIQGIWILIFGKKTPIYLFDWFFESTFIKLYSIEVCKRNGESCGHQGGILKPEFDGRCCEGSFCIYPTPPILGVAGKCIDEGMSNT